MTADLWCGLFFPWRFNVSGQELAIYEGGDSMARIQVHALANLDSPAVGSDSHSLSGPGSGGDPGDEFLPGAQNLSGILPRQ